MDLGNGSINQLLGEMLKLEAGIDMMHVPYRGVAPAISDVIAGHVNSAFSSAPSVLGLIKGGQVRALAVSSARRVDVAPDIPTIAESGYSGFDVTRGGSRAAWPRASGRPTKGASNHEAFPATRRSPGPPLAVRRTCFGGRAKRHYAVDQPGGSGADRGPGRVPNRPHQERPLRRRRRPQRWAAEAMPRRSVP